MKLNVIMTSTRPGRVGPAIGTWFHEYATQNSSGFDIELTDLAELALPMFNEPKHPSLQDYQHAHTKKWASIVESSDAFVFVLPEYNFSAPSSFFNAMDYLVKEWHYKAVGFVSYGGVSGGIRAVQSVKGYLTTFKLMPLPEQVMIPMVTQHLNDGVFQPEQIHRDSATTMITELAKVAKVLGDLR